MLICPVRVNVVLVFLLLGVFLGFVPVVVALFIIEDEAIRTLTGAVALIGTDSAAVNAMLATGQNRLNLALRLIAMSWFSNFDLPC
jgi:hypothetical protein